MLPHIDPAGSPRVGGPQASPRQRQENPYIPNNMPPYSGRPQKPMPPPGARSAMSAPRSARGAYTAEAPATYDAAAMGPVKVRVNAGAGADMVMTMAPSPASARSASASHHSPRSAVASDAAVARAAQQKRLERLQDSYVTALSRETLLSEQYDKELAQVKERLQHFQREGSFDAAKKTERQAMQKRTKLERRVAGFESKLNELETYNAKLVSMISALRKQNEPHRMASKRVTERLGKLATEMVAQKAACHKSLDERERCVDQMKHLQDDAVRDHADFEMAVEMLRRESDDLDDRNRRAEGVLEAATENEKRAQFSQMRKARARKEKLEVRYGYLRSQLEGVDNDFRELQRIVGVHFQPSHPESLQQIIDKFVEKERRVASLQKYWALQADEIGGLEFELASLGRELEYAEGVVAEAAAQEAFAQSFNAKVAPWDDGALDALTARFAKCSTGIERMFALLGGDLTETGQHLAAKGCTVSTLTDFLSTMAARLDETSRRAHSLRETAQTHRATATGVRRGHAQ